MRILLQDADTQLFYRSHGGWTADPSAALNFEHSGTAADHARRHRLERAQIVVKFVDPEFDTVAPLTETGS